MIRNQTASPSELWQQTAAKAAAEARWLGPLAMYLLVIAVLLIATEYLVLPVWKVLSNTVVLSVSQAVQQLLTPWIDAGAAISLAWALWEARLYLRRLERGEFWVASTMKLWGRIGESLLVAAVWMVVVAPTLRLWISDRQGGFDWNISASSLVLLCLGLLLMVMAPVLSQVLTTAEGLKADNEAIV